LSPVLASGGGTNLQALPRRVTRSPLARVVRVITNRPDAGALERARAGGVAATVLRDPGDAVELVAALAAHADLVVLAVT